MSDLWLVLVELARAPFVVAMIIVVIVAIGVVAVADRPLVAERIHGRPRPRPTGGAP